jgi:glycosyltransferase involved in cell wall biosynthesis
MNRPTFSLVVETANLSLADLDGLRETLDSLAAQSFSVQNAEEVILADSGTVPEKVLQTALQAYPWVRLMRMPEGTGYEDLKMTGALAAGGEVVVFADGDCLYDRGWLEALLAPFADGSVFVVGGETAIDSSGAYGLGVSLAASFPSRSASSSLYTSDRYHLNNVAFRRSVLASVPIPSQRPCYRMSGLHAANLLAAGYAIVRQPAARAVHAAPNGFAHFVWRFFLMGFDAVAVPRLIAAEAPSGKRSSERRRRTFKLLRFWASQAIAKLSHEIRHRPSRALTLPLAAPVFAGAVALQVAGAVGGLLAPGPLLRAVPDDVLRGSTCRRDVAAAPGGK